MRSSLLRTSISVLSLLLLTTTVSLTVDAAIGEDTNTNTNNTASLTHPDVLTFPMIRSLSAMKTTQKAANGDADYQRLYNAMAHGFELNRAQRIMSMQKNAEGMHTMADATPSPTTFYGCPFADFVIPVIIGSSTFQLIVDTGSSTLAVAGSSCTNCKSGTAAVTPLWSATNGVSVDQGVKQSGSYGDQSGWLGEVWSDKVSLQQVVGTTSQVTQRIVVITSQSQTNIKADGTSSQGAQPFFVKNPCNDATTPQKQKIFSQGIIGVGYQGLAATGTDSFMAMLWQQYPALPNTYALQMCEYSGNMWVGGLDTTSYTGNMLYIDIMKHKSPNPSLLFFSVAPQAMYVGGVSVGVTQYDWSSEHGQIIDSGTTFWSLPSDVYRAVIDAILADPGFRKYFRYASNNNFFDQPNTKTCEQSNGNVAASVLQAALPTISIQFKNGVTLTMDGVGSYMMPCSTDYDSWTAGIVDGGPVSDQNFAIGGWSLMNQFIVNHDMANNKIGFAKQTSCSTGVRPIKAQVLQGQPLNDTRSASSTTNIQKGLLAGLAILGTIAAL